MSWASSNLPRHKHNSAGDPFAGLHARSSCMVRFYALIAMVIKKLCMLAEYSASCGSIFRKNSDPPAAVLGLYDGLEIV